VSWKTSATFLTQLLESSTAVHNGVYLSNGMYEELTGQNESRRILTEEQGAKIETLEANLRNKLEELLLVASNFRGLKQEHEGTRRLNQKLSQ